MVYHYVISTYCSPVARPIWLLILQQLVVGPEKITSSTSELPTAPDPVSWLNFVLSLLPPLFSIVDLGFHRSFSSDSLSE